MSLQNDISFLQRLNLENFRQIEKSKFNFRCPICLDSKKSKRKARGYALPHKVKDSLHIYCHNCSYSSSFYHFLKELSNRGVIDGIVFESYIFQEKNEKIEEETFIVEEPIKEKLVKENKYLINVNRFKEGSIVRKYLKARKVDEKYFDDIYFSLNLKTLINQYYQKDKFYKEIDFPRLVFPIVNNEKLIGFQGRSIYNTEYRYMNVKFDGQTDFIFIQKNIDENEIIFVTEGIFDCFMIDNSIAMLGSNLSENVLNRYKKVIFIYDNEKRNQEILSKYKKVIDKEGIGLFIWPKSLKFKDLNEWAMKEGKENIKRVILKNSFFKKIEKYLYFSNWK